MYGKMHYFGEMGEMDFDIKKYVPLFFITLFGAFLRFYQLNSPLFVDEALFGLWVRHNLPMQEWLPILLTRLMPDTEFGLRFLFIVSGTLTIPTVYHVVKHNKLLASFIVAIFPLFIFWSRMARPYAMAGLFLVLGWRYYWCYIPALFCTPIALIGIKIIKQKWFVLVSAVLFAIIFFFIRPDTERFTNSNVLDQLTYSTRFWYLPLLTILLYLFEFKIKWLHIVVAFIVGVLFIKSMPEFYSTNQLQWYKYEVRIGNWRDIPPLDYATNVPPAWYYSKKMPKYLRREYAKEFLNDISKGDTLLIGVDYLANYILSNGFFNNDFTLYRENGKTYPIQVFLKAYIRLIIFGERVIVLKAYREGNKIVMEKQI